MNSQIVKQDLNKKVEEYYEQFLTLANSLQCLVNDQLLNAFFNIGLLPYLRMATADMEQG
jgi:hypothetical protein